MASDFDTMTRPRYYFSRLMETVTEVTLLVLSWARGSAWQRYVDETEHDDGAWADYDTITASAPDRFEGSQRPGRWSRLRHHRFVSQVHLLPGSLMILCHSRSSVRRSAKVEQQPTCRSLAFHRRIS
jgi:hypothetical protein